MALLIRMGVRDPPIAAAYPYLHAVRGNRSRRGRPEPRGPFDQGRVETERCRTRRRLGAIRRTRHPDRRRPAARGRRADAGGVDQPLRAVRHHPGHPPEVRAGAGATTAGRRIQLRAARHARAQLRTAPAARPLAPRPAGLGGSPTRRTVNGRARGRLGARCPTAQRDRANPPAPGRLRGPARRRRGRSAADQLPDHLTSGRCRMSGATSSDSGGVFVSWTRADTDRTGPLGQLVDALRAADVPVWIDDGQLGPFAPIPDGVGDGLSQAKVLLAWYSHAYPTRRACREELTLALLAAENLGQGARRVLVVNSESGLDHVLEARLLDRRFATAEDLQDPAALARRIADRVGELEAPLSAMPAPGRVRWYGGDGWE